MKSSNVSRPVSGLALLALLSVGTVHAQTPQQQAKATLGGVISSATLKTMGKTPYLLAVRQPYIGGRWTLHLLRSFAGRFVPLWTAPRDWGENQDFLAQHELLDLNRDGQPEVFYADFSAGNTMGSETYNLFDSNSKRLYTVEVAFVHGGGPGQLEIDPQLSDAKAQTFRTFLENKVALSDYLTDQRNMVSKTWDTWMERYGALFEPTPSRAPLKITPPRARLQDSLCKDLSSVDTEFSTGGITYRALFKYGVMAFDSRLKECRLIVALPYDVSVKSIRAVSSELRFVLSDGRILVYQPTRNTLSWL